MATKGDLPLAAMAAELGFVDRSHFTSAFKRQMGIRNGMWVNNTPHPATEAGTPTVGNIQVYGNSIEIGPFNTAGTYHIYCTVHPGMNLTVIVQ